MKQSEPTLIEKLYSETALMHWKELQKFFAQGKVLCVKRSLDLVQTAVWFAEDSAKELKPYIDSQVIAQPSNDQARAWYNDDEELWAVVVAPYVLVQEQKE